MLRGRVAHQLIDAAHCLRIESHNAPIVGYPKEQPPATAVGECCKLGGETVCVGCVLLELVPTVFAALENLQEFGLCHDAILPSYWQPVPSRRRGGANMMREGIVKRGECDR